MSLKVNVSGTWKYLSTAHIKVSDAWKPCTNIHVNINGTWRPLYSYKWSTGNWGTCSATCGGGTQTRTVTCTRSHASNNSLDQQTVADAYCTKTVGTKPATSQSCNTQSCQECKYQQSSCMRNQYSFRQHWTPPADWGKDAFSFLEYVWEGSVLARAYSQYETSRIINGYNYSKGATKDVCYYTSGSTAKIRNFEICRQPV